MTNIFKSVVKLLVIRPYYALRGTLPLWYLINLRRWLLFLIAPSSLSLLEERIVRELKEDGISLTSLEELFSSHNPLAELQAAARNLLPHARVSEKKAFFVDLWDTKRIPFDLEDPFMKLALNRSVTSIAHAYFGMYGRFYGTRAMKTQVMPAGDAATQSQLWHRDPDDRMICKMFVYLNDVDEGTGPFSYLMGSHRRGHHWKDFPQLLPGEGGSGRISDEELRKKISHSHEKKCLGSAGTVIFADTAGLHKGGYSTQRARVMFLATFMSGVPFTRPSRRRKVVYPKNFHALVEKFPFSVREALRRPLIEIP